MVFLDAETCGLGWDDPIWEVAAIRRVPGRPDVEHHAFVEHDPAAASGLPDEFRADHDARYDPKAALDHDALVAWLTGICAPTDGHRPVLLGAVPSFDAIRLTTQHRFDPWHYRPVCVETMAWTALHLRTLRLTSSDPDDPGVLPSGGALGLPWKSDLVTTAIGVPSVTEGRHTALVDARWVRDTFDMVMSMRPRPVDPAHAAERLLSRSRA